MISDKVAALLPLVQKPARYTGGELNSITKNLTQVKTRVAFCFADLYEVGMSHLGTRILYDVANKVDGVYCERCFAPWTDMEALLRQHQIPLYTLETGTPLSQMDMVAFTLQYEMSYTNLLNMLDMGGVPVLAKERTDADPLVIAGGPCACNPEPLADFVDLFLLGEGEEAFPEILEALRDFKGNRRDFIREAVKISGVYAPSLYRPEYNEDGTLKGTFPIEEGVPEKVKKRLVAEFDKTPFPEKPLVPYLDIVFDRVSLEIFRGCTRGCRFCQAGMIYRPVRERSVDTLVEQAMKCIKATGYDELSLSSLSSGDYSQLKELIHRLLEETKDCRTAISLPSLRVDSYTKEAVSGVEDQRKAGLTLAPEAGTQRLRDVINKNITQEQVLASVTDAFASGWDRVKLYFMTGLPTESEEDVLGIAQLARDVVHAYYITPQEGKRRRLSVTVSTAVFVPKPFTPFQWCPQHDLEEVRARQELLHEDIKRTREVKYDWHDGRLSYLEAVVARGDRKVGRVIYRAWQLGARFDGWNDLFRYDLWLQAFADTGIDPAFYARRQRGEDEVFPWDHMDLGIDKAFLLREYHRALEEKTTPDCRQGCQGCGMSRLRREKGASPCVG